METTGYKTVKVSMSNIGQQGIINQAAIDAATAMLAVKMTRALDAEIEHALITGGSDRINPDPLDITVEFRIITDEEMGTPPHPSHGRPCICTTGGWFDGSGICFNCGGVKA